MKNSSAEIDPRYEAIRLLREIDEKEVFAQDLLSEKCSSVNLSKRDKSLLTTLVNGVIRQRQSLDTIISFFSRISLHKIEPWILIALRLGIYQIIYLDKIPASAAINTSVGLVKKLVCRTDAVRFTNAILRSAERSIQNKSFPEAEIVDPRHALYRGKDTWCLFHHAIFPDPQKQPISSLAANYSHPEWLIKRWITRHGREKTVEMCKADNSIPKVFLRVNNKKISNQEFMTLLEKEGIHSHSVNGALAVNATPISEIPGFAEGLFFVQDISAMKVAQFLRLEKTHRVLDMCAAPGGKATHMAELLESSGRIYALDVSFKRLQLLRENCLRMGVHNIFTVCGDASDDKVPFQDKFDRVLADVPCSNTGVFSRRVEARWRLTEAGIEKMSVLQYSILKTGSTLLKNSGYLVYSTCSIEPEENQDLVRRFLKNNSRFCLDREEFSFPSILGGNGGYIARICVKPEMKAMH
ncbi:MAG: 16S rRNA (cytosine(967)-C(5))-methyltransferase RsmB [Candidatus Brocadiaceae bacterium]|nr:16S rRNA (cytosine(967)-C(5))-methyltransferase RsmB [Candidatus Brocadiaceae bacterium]